MGLLRSTATVGLSTLLSRLLGFVRDMVIARSFGAAAGTDAFFVAFKIPNFLRRLFAEGAFSQAFVPVLSEYKTQRTHEEVRVLVGSVLGTLGGVLLLISTLSMLAAPLLVYLFAPGFSDDAGKFDLTVQMLRITFPYLLFISLTALAGGVLNSYGKFAIPAITPVWLNICMIGAALWAAPLFDPPVVGLAWGVFVAGVVQLVFQAPYLRKIDLLAAPRWAWRESGVQRILKLMLPAIFGSSVAQINLLLDTIIASFLATGSVSWLYYSDRLVEFPLGVFGVALGTVILPALSLRHAEAAPEEFSKTLDWALRWTLMIGLPATFGLMILSGPMVVALYKYGAFSVLDAQMSTYSLMAFAAGLPAFMLIKVLAPGFYARHDTRTPVRIGVIAMAVNMGLNLLVIAPLAYMGVPALHAGLALVTGIAATLNASLLFRRLRRDGAYRPEAGWRSFALKIGFANLLMVALLLLATGDFDAWLAMRGSERIVRLTLLILGGAAVYFAALAATGIRLDHLRGRHSR